MSQGQPQAQSHRANPPIPIPESARAIHGQIVDSLGDLLYSAPHCCTDTAFSHPFRKILLLVDSFQAEVLKHYSRRKTCVAGCFHCCYHWVEDTYCFEAELIARLISEELPGQVDEIMDRLTNDGTLMDRLELEVNRRLAEEGDAMKDAGINPFNLLLSSFYQLKRRCSLLGSDGRCLAYEIRPLTCRSYISFMDPCHCSPERINEGEVATYVLDLEDDATEILDKLHEKYARYDEDTGLRSLILAYLRDS